MSHEQLIPARELAARNPVRIPNESAAYREARRALLADEIELRRHIERVAEQRRALPLGPEVKDTYIFTAEDGRKVSLRELFGHRSTLILYSYMMGEGRDTPCPMCTSFMGTWEKKLPDLEQRVAMAFIARGKIEQLKAAKRARGWENLKVYSDESGEYTRAFVSAKDEDVPGLNVFTRRADKIYFYYANEMGAGSADPGQDPRGAPDIDPLWTLLDMTPEGRGKDWYPKLRYD